MKENTRKKLFWIFLVLSFTWMGIIFFFSAQPATQSAKLSKGVMNDVLTHSSSVSVFHYLFEKDILELLIRKLAHMAEYAILAVFLGITIQLNRKWNRKWQLKTVILSCLYASSDEFHQLFVTGRSGQLNDVAIDSAGAVCGMLFLCLCHIVYLKVWGKNKTVQSK